MDKMSNVALILQMIEAAEKNIQSAKQLLRENLGGASFKTNTANLLDKAGSLSVSEGGKVIEGVFDGQNMIGPDNKQYLVPANYASKSKLVEGDVLKLTITDDGSFIYKQIAPIERKKVLGLLLVDERGDFRVVADGKTYKVLLASLTYFKAEAGDEVTIVVPKDGETQWAAVENVIKKGSSTDLEMGSSDEESVTSSEEDAPSEVHPATSSKRVVKDMDEEL
jgi:hypothetical protein